MLSSHIHTEINNIVCMLNSVAIGVKHFKASEHDKAMKYLTHALEIDKDNVEGLVARGAL